MSFTPTPHPILITPSQDDIKRLVEKVGTEKTTEILNLREDKILAEKLDPYRHGFDLPHWYEADEFYLKKIMKSWYLAAIGQEKRNGRQKGRYKR
jgi:hypothetical protein